MTSPGSSAHIIARLVASDLASALERLCTHRYGRPLPRHWIRVADRPEAAVDVHLGGHNQGEPWADITVHHVGGNVYDVKGTVTDGPTRSFTYCLSDPAPLLTPAAPRLSQEIAAFLLDAFEQKLGSAFLCRRTRTVRPGAAEEPSSPAASARTSP